MAAIRSGDKSIFDRIFVEYYAQSVVFPVGPYPFGSLKSLPAPLPYYGTKGCISKAA